jgi:hypothetical protein
MLGTPSVSAQLGIALAGGIYLLAFYLLAQSMLMPAMCLMATGGGVCCVSLARLRQRQ